MKLRSLLGIVSTSVVVTGVLACGGSTAPAPAAPSPPTSASAPIVTSAGSAPTPVSVGAPSASASGPPSSGTASGPMTLVSKAIALPGVTAPASLDYIAFERSRSRVWVPVSDTGSVELLDTATLAFTRIGGFKTAEREMHGHKRIAGPSAAAVGDGFVYVGNRATQEVCPVSVTSDASAAKVGKCLKLASPTDGVAYVASAKEVWVTTPKDNTLTVLDASTPGALRLKTTVKVDGAPEGYAVDDAHGLFFTNLERRGLEDKDGTVVIDVKTHKVKATWSAGCGTDGPRGLVFDGGHGFVVVACTDHLQVLDAGHDGAMLGKLDTGAGVDNLDFLDGKSWIYAAAAKDGRLSIARVDDKGQLTLVASGPTAVGARNAVADLSGNAYVADGPHAQVWVITAPNGG